jgi:hypothetical protein
VTRAIAETYLGPIGRRGDGLSTGEEVARARPV